MKTIAFCLVLLLRAFSGFAQEAPFHVFGTQTNPYAGPYFIVTMDTLDKAQTISDIYTRYQSSWVSSYHSVEVSSTCNGTLRKAVTTDDRLSPEQLDILKTANKGCQIDVEVDYVPDNDLKDNPPRKMHFSLTPVPIYEAKFPGGSLHLKAYLKENIPGKIPPTSSAEIEFAKASFTVNAEGQVSDLQIVESSKDESMDQLILTAIRNMPQWTPAKDREGRNIVQEFELTMGSRLLRCDYIY